MDAGDDSDVEVAVFSRPFLSEEEKERWLRWCEEGAVVEEVTEEVGEVSTSKDIKEEESLRYGSKTAGDQEAKLADLKNKEEKVSQLDHYLKEMEEIARKGGDEYQGMLEKVLQEMLDKRARDCQEEAEKELLRFAAHLIR